MKRVLFLLGRYFPKASANSVCVKNIIDALPKDEYYVEVVAYNDGFDMDYNIDVQKFGRGGIQSLIYKFESKKNFLLGKITNVLHLIQKAKLLLCAPIWPWFDPIVTVRELRMVRRENEKKHFDIVVAVHTPLSSLIVGNSIKKEFPDIQYIAYFLDSLAGGYIPRHVNQRKYEKKCKKWETRVIKRADKLVFMKSSENYHSHLFENTILGAKICYLDIPMLIKRENVVECRDNCTRLVYVGSLASSMRNPKFILEVFSNINDPTWEFIFVGDSTCQIVNEFAAKDTRIKVVGRCSHEEAVYYERKASILVNLGNSNPNMAPSKVFEYMGWCKKIVSTYSIENDTSCQYLLNYPAALMLDERLSVDSAAKTLIEFVNRDTVVFDYSLISELFYTNTPEAFINLL